MNTKMKTAYVLSMLIAALAVVASTGGLFLKGLYRDNAFVTTTWLGNDAVTLFLAVPILMAVLYYSSHGSMKAQLIWMGALDYMLYNYAFYLFGTAFNAFFLIYVALLGLSILALIFGLANLDVNRISQQFRKRTPVKWIGGYFLFVAFGLSMVYVMQSIGFIFTGQLPPHCPNQRASHQYCFCPGFDPACAVADPGRVVVDKTPTLGVCDRRHPQCQRAVVHARACGEFCAGAARGIVSNKRTSTMGNANHARLDRGRAVLWKHAK